MQISNRKSEIVNHKSGARPGSIAAQFNARQNAQALANLDYSIRSQADRLGADQATADALVVEARRVFTITNALPVARDAHGQTLLAENGLPLTPDQWLNQRLRS